MLKAFSFVSKSYLKANTQEFSKEFIRSAMILIGCLIGVVGFSQISYATTEQPFDEDARGHYEYTTLSRVSTTSIDNGEKTVIQTNYVQGRVGQCGVYDNYYIVCYGLRDGWYIPDSVNVVQNSDGIWAQSDVATSSTPAIPFTYEDAITKIPSPIEKVANSDEWEFAGWFESENGGRQLTKITPGTKSDVVVYAVYKPRFYIVHFKDGENFAMNDIKVRRGQSFTLPYNEISREGYVFDGWIKEDNPTVLKDQELISQDLTDTNEVTLTAQWKPIEYMLRISENDSPNPLVNTIPLAYDQSYTLPNENPAIIGYNTSPDGNGFWFAPHTIVSKLTSANQGLFTLYAQYKDAPAFPNVTATFTFEGNTEPLNLDIFDPHTTYYYFDENVGSIAIQPSNGSLDSNVRINEPKISEMVIDNRKVHRTVIDIDVSGKIISYTFDCLIKETQPEVLKIDVPAAIVQTGEIVTSDLNSNETTQSQVQNVVEEWARDGLYVPIDYEQSQISTMCNDNNSVLQVQNASEAYESAKELLEEQKQQNEMNRDTAKAPEADISKTNEVIEQVKESETPEYIAEQLNVRMTTKYEEVDSTGTSNDGSMAKNSSDTSRTDIANQLLHTRIVYADTSVTSSNEIAESNERTNQETSSAVSSEIMQQRLANFGGNNVSVITMEDKTSGSDELLTEKELYEPKKVVTNLLEEEVDEVTRKDIDLVPYEDIGITADGVYRIDSSDTTQNVANTTTLDLQSNSASASLVESNIGNFANIQNITIDSDNPPLLNDYHPWFHFYRIEVGADAYPDANMENMSSTIPELTDTLTEAMENCWEDANLSNIGFYAEYVPTASQEDIAPHLQEIIELQPFRCENYLIRSWFDKWYYNIASDNACTDFFYISPKKYSLNCTIFVDNDTGRTRVYVDSIKLVFISPTGDVISSSQAQEYHSIMNSKISEIISSVPAGLSEVHKAKYVHDWLLNNCQYNFAVVEERDSNPDRICSSMLAWSPYSALVTGNPVCLGYAKGYKAVLDAMGIETTIVSNHCYDAEGEYSGHAWNRSKLDGEWYNIDVTWDEPMGCFFFCKSDAYWIEDAKKPGHELHGAWTEPGVPGTSTLYDNFDFNSELGTYFKINMSDLTFSIEEETLTDISHTGHVTYTGKPFEPGFSAQYQNTYKFGLFKDRTPADMLTLNLNDYSWFTYSYKDNINAGTAQIIIHGNDGIFEGDDVILTFEIDKVDISKYKVASIPDQYYDAGKPICPLPFDYDVPFSEENLSLRYTNNTSVGTAQVFCSGRKNFTGTIDMTYQIKPRPIDYWYNDNYVIPDQIYSAIPLEPVRAGKTVITEDSGATKEYYLREGTDYAVAYTNNTNVGTASVTIMGKGNCTGLVTRSFKISKRQITSKDIDDLQDVVYSGEAQTVQNINFVVSEIGYHAQAGNGIPIPAEPITKQITIPTSEYSVTYKNNVNAGTATATFLFRGNLSGTVIKQFKIKPREVLLGFNVNGLAVFPTHSGDKIKWDKPYEYCYDAGEAIVPTPSISIFGLVSKDLLAANNDSLAALGLKITCSNNVNIGTAHWSCTITNKNYTTPYDISQDFKIVPWDLKASEYYSSYEYSGFELKPTTYWDLTTHSGKKIVLKDTVKHEYSNNVHVGTATVKITAPYGYTINGKQSYSKKFNITPHNFTYTKNNVPWLWKTRTFNGKNIEPTVNQPFNGKNVNFKYKYSNNLYPGIATVMVTTPSSDFTINGQRTYAAKFTIIPHNFTYTKNNVPAVWKTRTFNGKNIEPTINQLSGGKKVNFKYKYSNNLHPGTATVTITTPSGFTINGKNTYTAKFKIAKAENPLTVTNIKRIVRSYKTVKKQSITSKLAVTAKTAKGKVKIKKVSGNKNLTIANNGYVTIKKGTPKGTYKLNVKITATGNADYKSATKYKTITAIINDNGRLP